MSALFRVAETDNGVRYVSPIDNSRHRTMLEARVHQGDVMAYTIFRERVYFGVYTKENSERVWWNSPLGRLGRFVYGQNDGYVESHEIKRLHDLVNDYVVRILPEALAIPEPLGWVDGKHYGVILPNGRQAFSDDRAKIAVEMFGVMLDAILKTSSPRFIKVLSNWNETGVWQAKEAVLNLLKGKDFPKKRKATAPETLRDALAAMLEGRSTLVGVYDPSQRVKPS